MNLCWRPRGALLTAAENLRAQPTLQSPPPLLQCACVPVFLARCVSLLYDVVRVRANPLSQEHVCVTPATLIFHLHLETVHDASQSPDPERHGKNMCYQYSLNIKIVTLLCKGKAHNFCFTNMDWKECFMSWTMNLCSLWFWCELFLPFRDFSIGGCG